MGYKKATNVLPQHLLRARNMLTGSIRIFPARKKTENTGRSRPNRAFRAARNTEMAARRKAGWSVAQLAERYFLSEKAVYKILAALN
ncbi:MAG: hypothetical protein QM665_02925 [Desulfovibrio sp.]